VDSVDDLMGRGNYIPNDIGTVKNSLDLNTDYGSINVEKLMPTVKSVVVRSDYTGVKMAYDPAFNFDFVIKLSYAGLNGKESLSMSTSDVENTRKTYSGYHGTIGSGNTIDINSSYGGVTLTKL
jgi:hypothetical protein